MKIKSTDADDGRRCFTKTPRSYTDRSKGDLRFGVEPLALNIRRSLTSLPRSCNYTLRRRRPRRAVIGRHGSIAFPAPPPSPSPSYRLVSSDVFFCVCVKVNSGKTKTAVEPPSAPTPSGSAQFLLPSFQSDDNELVENDGEETQHGGV